LECISATNFIEGNISIPMGIQRIEREPRFSAQTNSINLQCKSSLVILLKVACVYETGFLRELVYNSKQILQFLQDKNNFNFHGELNLCSRPINSALT